MLNKSMTYLCRLSVRLNAPFLKEGINVMGYVMNICMDANSALDAKGLAMSYVDDGTIDWSNSVIKEATEATVSEDILKLRIAGQERGVWYRSGRVLFPDS